MIPTTELRWCGGCAAETAFDRFDCSDHSQDCLELVCTMCGEGVELALPVVAATEPAVEVEVAA